MPRYLSIECEWIDQPVASDPLERQTWARLRINVTGQTVTRLLDRVTSAERQSIFVPAFPLANWLVFNWWILLNEAKRDDKIPTPEMGLNPKQRQWLQHHCLRAAEAGLMLPRLCFYGDGRDLVAEWFEDPPDAFPQMPGHFVSGGRAGLSREHVEAVLDEFICGVCGRITGIADERAQRLIANWQAIRQAEPDEKAFCRATGKVGLDAYRSGEWPEVLTSLFEEVLSDNLEQQLVADFLECTDVDTAVDLWKWIESARMDYHLAQAPPMNWAPLRIPANAVDFGYNFAREIRRQLDISSTACLNDLQSVAAALEIPRFRVEPRNHLPNRGVKGAVGWCGRNQAILVAPPARGHSSQRFRDARALFHIATGCAEGPRLITDARTWDQQASRAFAAELLAPQQGLLADLEATTDATDSDEHRQTLADHFRVSHWVVSYQLQNAGVSLDLIE